jgi:uncharacterized protein (TIGR03083 family)
MPIDYQSVRRSIAANAERAAALLRSLPTTDTPIPRSQWTIGEAAAHMVTSLDAYGGMATGRRAPEPVSVTSGPANTVVAKLNDERIATVDKRDGASLAAMLLETAGRFVDETASIPGDTPFQWYDGAKIDVASISAIMLGEIVLHTYDIAQAARQSWPLDARDAENIQLGSVKLATHYVNPETTRGVRASWEVRIRGGTRVALRLADGQAAVEEPPSSPCDCVVSADPVALMLVAYGRIGPWGPVLRGKMLSFGRKPLLGLKLNSYFLQP